MGKFFRLKAGSHHIGNDANDSRVFRSNDPQALKSDGNIVESEEDLAILEPTRWEEYRGEIPERLKKRVGGPGKGTFTRATIAGEPPPPGPTSASDIAEAADITAVNKMSPDELERHAEALIERAEAMKQRALESKQAQQQNEQRLKEIRASQEDEDDDEAPVKQPSPQQTAQRQPVATEKVNDAALDRMSLEDLKTHAKTRNIDLKGATKREDILKTVKASK